MITLKKFWREILILVLFAVCFISMRSCRTAKNNLVLKNQSYDSAYSVAIEHVLKNGQLAYQVQTLEATVHDLKGQDILSTIEQKNLHDQVGNLSRLVTFYKGSLTMDDTFSAGGTDTVYLQVKGRDTTRVKKKTFLWHGQWLTLASIYDPITDSISHRYHYQVDFNLISYRQGQNFFRRGNLVSDITFSDPAVSVGEFRGIIVKEPPKKWYETGVAKFLAGLAAGVALRR